MREFRARRRLTSVTLASLLALAPAVARANRSASPDAELEAFRRDPQCGSQAAMEALHEFFHAQGENVAGLGRSAGKLAEAAGKAAPAAAAAAHASSDLGKLAGDVAKAGPEAARQSEALAKAIAGLAKEAGAIAALDLAGAARDGGALVSASAPPVAACSECAAAMAAALTGHEGLAGRTAGPCGQAVEDAAKFEDAFARIQRLVGAAVALGESIRNSAQHLAAAADALPRLAQELGRGAQPGIDRLEGGLNLSIDAINAAGQAYDGDVAPRLAKLPPSLLQQLADNADRLMSCYGKLQDAAGRKTKRPAPIRVTGSLPLPGGLALPRPVAKIRLGAPPPAKAR